MYVQECRDAKRDADCQASDVDRGIHFVTDEVGIRYGQIVAEHFILPGCCRVFFVPILYAIIVPKDSSFEITMIYRNCLKLTDE